MQIKSNYYFNLFIMSNYKFAALDPRPEDKVPSAKQANERIFDGNEVLGIEVTNPKLAARCSLGNIDPQHSEGRHDRTAIEEAVECALPPENSILATVRPDPDSVGAMAILSLRADQTADKTELSEDIRSRIAKIAESDKFAHGDWPGKTDLPSRENPWPEGASAKSLGPIGAAVSDFKVPLEQRVATMKKWLESGIDPIEYDERIKAIRQNRINALENGEIKIEVVADGHIAVVKSAHEAGTSLGYSQAPVVIALNPSFQFQGGTPHAKFTVCQFKAGYVDLNAVKEELSVLEPGWGGSPTILGSPQGTASQLSVDKVIEVVARHLVDKK